MSRVTTYLASALSVALLSSLLVVPLTGCAGTPAPDGDETTRLEDVEIREYEGMPLDSVTDFRENSISGPPQVDIDEYRLRIDGLVTTPTTLTYEEVVDGLPAYEKALTLYCVEGWDATVLVEGVLMRDLIALAGPTDEADTVILHAADGYTSSLPLAYHVDNDILLAYEMNGVTLPVDRGFPFQFMAEDKWGYKWVRWVERIELSDDDEYEGFWERRGYSNTGDLDEPYFD
jgi:DMSO/TMAO reductase YedYZ molybdopterin-dependent catalytic subunit